MSMKASVLLAVLSAVLLLIASPAFAQGAARPAAKAGLLRDLNASVEDLTARVALSVVQVVVTGYAAVDERTRGESGLVIGRQRSIGSGAIVDPDGYIITNAHVVAGARQVQVVVHRDTTADGPVRSLALLAGQTVDARVVGIATDIDLALLKVDLTGLPALPFANYDAIRQGELVFAFGSPQGLRNSVSMGVVSSVARQVDPDSPTIYIQTDAPINPGNSGGPLVNIDGELVGLNTFILTESGGSQGLGFAIPSAIVAAAYPQLRKYGHLHHGQIGFSMQTITPALAAGLGLLANLRCHGVGRPAGECGRDGRHRHQGRGDGRQRKTGGERADALARVEPVPGRRDGGAGPPARKRRLDGPRDGDGAAASDR